jgi:hypothetical protein
MNMVPLNIEKRKGKGVKKIGQMRIRIGAMAQICISGIL